MSDTRSNVSARNVAGMDENWRRLEGSWERLIWARERWQKMNARPLTAADAAVALQMKEGTYRAYERPPGTSKYTSLGYKTAQKFAGKFRVNWRWLLHGSPFDPEQSPSAPMVVAIKAEFDAETQSWWAEAEIDEQHALTTGAPSLDELLNRIPVVLKDLLADAYPDTDISFSVVAVAHKTGVVNTRAA